MRLVRLLITAWVFVFGFSLSLQAREKTDVYRSLSVDSSFVKIQGNRSLSSFGSEFFAVPEKGFDLVSNTFIGSNFISRAALWGMYSLFVPQYFLGPYFITQHEWGHAARAQATGAKPFMRFEEQPDKKYSHPLLFLVDAYRITGIATGGGEAGSTQSSVLTPFESRIIGPAGGTNNETYFVQNLEDQIYYHNGHMFGIWAYYKGKIAAQSYVDSFPETDEMSGDMVNTANSYQAEGIDITKSDIRRGSRYSFFASATAYSYIFSNIRYIVTGNPTVNTLELLRVRLPDTNFYLNPEGLSYRISSGFSLSKTTLIPLAVEMVYKGKKRFEVSGGIHKILSGSDTLSRKSKYSLMHAVLFVSEGIGLESYYENKPYDFLFFRVGLNLHNNKTLDGRRNSISYEQAYSPEFYASLGMRY
jgi:hypothetical protein